MTKKTKRYEGYSVIILGPLNLQNEFLNYAIERELGASCQIYDNEIRKFPEGFALEKVRPDTSRYLFLVDSTAQSMDKTMKDIHTNGYLENSNIALINLKEEAGIEKKALSRQVRGFFYKDDSFDVFMHGVRAIFDGEVWISKEVLLQVVLDTIEEKRVKIQEKTELTQRQIEILNLVSMGATNEEIARKMDIATNTVKTHLYHIFKKIQVPNRLQAALWASKNL